MQALHIDKQDGQILLPNGASIGADLTQDGFRASPAGREAESRDYGTLPWIHYSFGGGEIDGKRLHVSLCFYDQVLTDVRLTVSFYPPGATDWSDYSLEVEARTKQFHDRLLEGLLGRPSRGGGLIFRRLPDFARTLDRPLTWRYAWGRVLSGHDSKGGGTYIVVSYGNRGEEARRAYRARRTAGGGRT